MESVQSFERGLAVIRSFSDRRPLTLADVSRATGLSRAVVRRLIHTLENEGYVTREGRTFQLTSRVLALGHAYLSSHTLPQVARPTMRALADEVRESVFLAELDESAVLILARIRINRPMSLEVDVGTRLPAYRTSLGQVLLAQLDEDEVSRIWDTSTHTRRARRTIRTREELTRRLHETRRLGYALADGELVEGMRSVAVPIPLPGGPPTTALTVCTHVSRCSTDDVTQRILPALCDAAEAIAANMAPDTADPTPAR